MLLEGAFSFPVSSDPETLLRQGLIAILKRRKRILVLLAKLLIVAAPIVYLIEEGRFDLGRQVAIFHEPASIALLFLLWAVSFVGLMAWRWRILARVLDLQLPVGFALQVHLAGIFLSSWLPASIGGDLWRAYRFGALLKTSGRRTTAYLSVVLDRVVGLYVLMLVGSACVLIDIERWLASDFSVLALLLLAACALATALGLLTLYAPLSLPSGLKALAEKVTARSDTASLLAANLRSIRKNRRILPGCLALSVLIQVLNLLLFGIVAELVTGQPIGFVTVSAVFTIGLLVTIASMAPGGLGVGHLMFDVLFADLGLQSGADVFNVFFFVTTFFAFLGLLPYLLPDMKDDRRLE